MLLAPSKPSIRIPIGHEICGVSVSVTVDFNNLTVDALITDWSGLHTTAHTEALSINVASY